ncbi:hypothetical protein HYW19_03550 [Candidatus Woesearchaeota archaeon]|nr:hypothetical protein [Candidatus Woesearchaeota archaeon]
MDSNVNAVLTSGGKGSRNWPVNLLGLGMYYPKGLMRVMGIPIAEIQIEELKSAGIRNYHFLTVGTPNKNPLADRFRDGSWYNIHIDYATTLEGIQDRGSGDGLLRFIENRDPLGHSIVLANDNLYEADWQRAIEFHKRNKAAITVLVTYIKPRETIRSYGLLDTNGNDTVVGIIEKPKTETELMKALGIKTVEELDKIEDVPVNTGGYIVDNVVLAKLAKEGWVKQGREYASATEGAVYDMAGDLIKGCIEHGIPVYGFTIDSWGDLGTNTNYLSSVQRALAGQFPSVLRILRERGYIRLEENVWVQPETWKRENGKSLEQLVKEGAVTLGPNTFIARRVAIEPGAHIEYSAIEKDCHVRDAEIFHSILTPYGFVGDGAHIDRSTLGLGVVVAYPKKDERDSNEQPGTRIVRSFLGPDIFVPAGYNIRGSTIFPGVDLEGYLQNHGPNVLDQRLGNF